MRDLQLRDENLLQPFERVLGPHLFERFFGPALARMGESQGLALSTWAPSVDVSEDESAYRITADLPSVKRDDIEVTVKDGVLHIRGERRQEKEETDENRHMHRIERSFGRFERAFTLPDDADEKKIEAKCQDGTLTVAVPKSKQKSNGARTIPVL